MQVLELVEILCEGLFVALCSLCENVFASSYEWGATREPQPALCRATNAHYAGSFRRRREALLNGDGAGRVSRRHSLALWGESPPGCLTASLTGGAEATVGLTERAERRCPHARLVIREAMPHSRRMAGIVWRRGTLIESLVELAGFKAGLILSPDEVKRRLPEYADLLDGDPAQCVRTRAEIFDELAQAFLFSIGAAPSAEPASPMDLYAKYYPDREKLDVYNAIGEIAFREIGPGAISRGAKSKDLPWLVREAKRRFADLGEQIAKDWCELVRRATNESPWSRVRYVEWKNEVELRALFDDANLPPAHGAFLDQRFIDYLSRNFDDIDSIHWRKFERLSAEFFVREGAHVELGPGTNDDGVDLRVWWPGDDPEKPAAILVQCKRAKDKVDRTVLKALYADICHEGARSGLIVTTQGLSPGAEKTRVARGYEIEAADRPMLKEWIERMRSGHVTLL
jgi:restriction system protein